MLSGIGQYLFAFNGRHPSGTRFGSGTKLGLNFQTEPGAFTDWQGSQPDFQSERCLTIWKGNDAENLSWNNESCDQLRPCLCWTNSA
jgi:hypothetical protein